MGQFWKDGYLGLASFKGVPFRVDTSGVEFGWSTSVKEVAAGNELPWKGGQAPVAAVASKSEYPFIEKGTKGPRTYQVTARFNDRAEIKDGNREPISYLEDRAAFIAAVEEGTPGILQLPLSKPVLCYAARGSIGFSNAEGGQETLSITFIEVEQTNRDTVKIDNGQLADDTQEEIDALLKAAFADEFNNAAQEAIELPAYVSNFLLLKSKIGKAGERFSAFISKAQAIAADARELIQTPQRFAEYMLDAINDLTFAFTDPIDAVKAQLAIFETFRDNLPFGLIDNESEAGRRRSANNQAVAMVVENACVTGAGLAALNAEYETLNDAVLMRQTFERAVRTQQLRNGATEGWDAVYKKLGILLGAVVNDINDKANLPSVLTYTFADENVAFTLAHDFYEDATRGDEIVARNKVRNPLFCKRELEVLSR